MPRPLREAIKEIWLNDNEITELYQTLIFYGLPAALEHARQLKVEDRRIHRDQFGV